MRRIVTFFTLIALLSAQVSPFIAFAAEKNIAVKTFDVTFPTEVKINEAFDITVKANDAAGKKITDYEGTIFFDNMNRPPADVVLPSFGEDGYTFQLSDQGEHTFSKGFTFKKPGVYEIEVYEIGTQENNGDGVTKTLSITAVDGATPPVGKADITITEPVNNITVSSKTLTVAGTTKATSTVNILLNGKKATSTQSDKDGKYTISVGELVSGSNDIVAEVLDGEAKVIGTSQKTTIKFGVETPKITSLKIKEGEEVLAGESVNFIAVGDPNLKTVQVKVGEKNQILTEDKNNLGTYTGVLKTSEFEGDFNPVVAIESQLGAKVEIKDLMKFRTMAAKIENIEIKPADSKVRFTFDLTPDLDQIQYFEIKYGTETKKYTKTVTTYEKSKIQEDGKYTWYIPNIEPGEYFSTITALDTDKKPTTINSGEQTFTVALDAAPTCTIEKISGFKIEQSTGSYSVLTWDTLKEAAAYQIFKKDASGEFVMIDEVTTNKYRINIDTTTKEIVFEDFKIRGTCKNGDYTGEGAFSESVKVQTGPELILFFALFIASGVAFILVRRGYIN